MAKQNSVIVNYRNGFANVILGSRKIEIARRDEGPLDYLCPVDLISAALGSWITLTISAVAENKGITLDEIEVSVSRDTHQAEENHSMFIIEIELPVNLDDREKVLLFNSAKKCDVTKILKGEFQFQYQLCN